MAVNVGSHQTVTEKHKLNVPETMTEVLDVSDEEGESFQCSKREKRRKNELENFIR